MLVSWPDGVEEIEPIEEADESEPEMNQDIVEEETTKAGSSVLLVIVLTLILVIGIGAYCINKLSKKRKVGN